MDKKKSNEGCIFLESKDEIDGEDISNESGL